MSVIPILEYLLCYYGLKCAIIGAPGLLCGMSAVGRERAPFVRALCEPSMASVLLRSTRLAVCRERSGM